MKTYILEDGKYEVVRTDNGFLVDIRRNGQHWAAAFHENEYSKLFHALLNEIDGLEDSKCPQPQTPNT